MKITRDRPVCEVAMDQEDAQGGLVAFIDRSRFEALVNELRPGDRLLNWSSSIFTQYSRARQHLGLNDDLQQEREKSVELWNAWGRAQKRLEETVRRRAARAAGLAAGSGAPPSSSPVPLPQANESQGRASSSAPSSSALHHPAPPASLMGQGPRFPQPPAPSSPSNQGTPGSSTAPVSATASPSPSAASSSTLHHPAPPPSPSAMGPREPQTPAPRCSSAPGSDAQGSSAPSAAARVRRRLRVPAADDLEAEDDGLVLEEEEGEAQQVVMVGSVGPRARRFVRLEKEEESEDEKEAGSEEEDDDALGQQRELSETESEEDAPTGPQPQPPPAPQDDEDGVELDDNDDPLLPPPPPPQDDDEDDDAAPDNGLFNQAIKDKLVAWLQAQEVPVDVQNGLVERRYSLRGLFCLSSLSASFIKTVRGMGLPEGEAFTLLDKVKAEVSRRNQLRRWRKA